MRVAFDASILDFDRAGSATYARQILDHLSRLDEVDEVIVLRSGAGRGGTVARRLRLLWQDLVWAPFLMPRVAAKRGADVLHCPAYRAPLFSRLPCVVTVHDVYPLQNPGSFRPWWAWYFRHVIAAAAVRADRVITSSRFSADEICRSWAVDASRVKVIHYGVAASFEQPPSAAEVDRVRRAHALPERFFLFIGSLEPRKNFCGLLDAARGLREAGRDCRIVMVGPRGWRNRAIAEGVAQAADEGWLQRLGFVEDADLAALYGAARALVMPSLHEGFGFPVIEAMACGCPVIASRAGSLPEIAGDAGLLVDPLDATAIGAAMERVDDEDPLRRELVARGRERAVRYRWDRCAQETVSLYRELLAENGDDLSQTHDQAKVHP